jgi:spore maturation protein CgeB
VSYIGPRGLRDFDLVLSYTGGGALTELAKRLGARRVAPLVGHVDPQAHHPAPAASAYRGDLSYLGTYAPDRQAALEELFLHPARCAPARRFVIAGAQYPVNFGWLANIHFVRHLPPSEHPGFFCSSRLTLNVTRAPMARMGWCPSGRLFEAAACGAAIVSDEWDGLEDFFARDSEILIARASDDVLRALDMDDAQLARIGRAARERVMAQHTSDHRAAELIAALDSVRRSELAEA